MSVKVTPEQFVKKHAQNLKGSLDYIRQGVNRVNEAPTLKAAAKQDKMLQKITESVQSGKWARGLRSVSLEDWKRQMVDKGVNRIAQGIDGAAPKVQAFAEQLLPHIERGQAAINGMPDMTLEDSISRMSSFVRHMATFSKK